MSRTKDTWGEMVRRLAIFRNKHGHCNVQTNSTQDAPVSYTHLTLPTIYSV